ncbi:antiterminator Q family protein [Hahella aquimaris]|uniref:antiterminator Q family protein n=1 Tax=Hahella sp. HNIBRBA332 TaxID=3015983 RepID=UPI00273BBDBE|nr:antiterminator Q family protein [Hahella sp. HNIBRBA332]WLQ15400.1 antiterminator Q family protein [Hahella sp. HNIBRBA332]
MRRAVDETAWLLEQWARWSKINTDNVGYPSSTPFARMAGSSVRSPVITDQEAAKVDLAVSKLRARDEEMGEVVRLYYMAGENLSYVVRQMPKLDRRKADILVKSGVAWIDSALYVP